MDAAEELSFTEFHAAQAQKRQARKRDAAATEPGKPEAEEAAAEAEEAAAEAEQEAQEEKLSLKERAGVLVERQEVQIIVCIVIWLDLAAACVEMLLVAGAIELPDVNETGGWAPLAVGAEAMLARLLQSLLGFSLFFFALELLVLFFAFRLQMFTHGGYLLDIAVVVACMRADFATGARAPRLMGFLRVWRVVRLVNSLMASAGAAHDVTKEALGRERAQGEALQTDLVRKEEALRRESDAKAHVEQMLRGYKDEVETLSEALNIAALTVAEATGTGIGGEDEVNEALEQLEEDEDGEIFLDPEEDSSQFVVSHDGSFTARSGKPVRQRRGRP